MLQIKDLKNVLDLHHVPFDEYWLNGGLPMSECALCIQKKASHFEVYLVERNKVLESKLFQTEDEACKHFLKEFRIAV